MKLIYPLVGCVTLALTTGASAGALSDDFWLLGDFTQNVPCKGDGSDPVEAMVKISTDHGRYHVHAEAQQYDRLCRSRQDLYGDTLSLSEVRAPARHCARRREFAFAGGQNAKMAGS
jgi:hypothetical protein